MNFTIAWTTGNLLSVHICRFSLNIHFSWAFILAKMLCKHQKDLKFRQNSWGNKLAFNGKHCWICPGLLQCCFAQSFISLLVWRLKVSLNGNNTEWGKLKVTVYPPLASWFRTPRCAWISETETPPAISTASLGGLLSTLTVLSYSFTQHRHSTFCFF